MGRDPTSLERTVAVLLKFDDQPSRRSAEADPIRGTPRQMAEVVAEVAGRGVTEVQLVLDPITTDSIERAAEVKAMLGRRVLRRGRSRGNGPMWGWT